MKDKSLYSGGEWPLSARMRRFVVPVVLLLVALASLCPPAHARELRGVVRWVADGDTFVLSSGETVRLVGIDTPEIGKDGAPDQYFAVAARERLVALVEGRELAVVPGPRQRDRYGRMLALVRLPDGTLLNEVLVREGLAIVYAFDDDPADLRSALLAAQREAMDAGRGFWPRILALPEATGPWVGNMRSGRAFPAQSREAKKLAARNRVPLDGLDAVYRQGFSPARQVTPWPLAGQD